MSLPVIPYGATAEDVEQGLLLGSTIYDRNYDGDTIGHVDYHADSKRFIYHDYGECGRYGDPRKNEGCLAWVREPEEFEFERFVDLAVWLAFVGKEWT